MIDKNLWRQGKNHKAYLVATIVSGLLCAVTILWQAYLLAHIVYLVFIEGWTLDSLWRDLSLLILAMSVRAMLSWAEEWFALRLAVLVQQDLRGALVAKIDALGPLALGDEQVGQLLNLANEGIDSLEGYFGKYLPQLFKSALIPIIFLIFIFPIDWPSAIILLVTAPLVPFFMMLIGKWTESVNRKQWALLNRLTGYLNDVLDGLVTLKMLNRGEQQGSKIGQISESYRMATLGVLRWAFLSALTLELFTTLSIAVVSVGLGVRLVEGMLHFEQAFLLLLLAPEFYLPLRTLGGYFHTSLNGVTAAEQIYTFLNMPENNYSQNQTDLVNDGLGQILFDQVCFTYPEGQQPALNNVSFVINPHEKVALVGPSGSGKTTVLNLLLGFITPESGSIRIQGQPFAQLNQQAIREHIGLIPQKPYLFAGSIKDNILLGQPDCSSEDLEKIVEKIGLSTIISDLPEGLETMVGQGGQSLSGGQRQLVAMARCMIKNAEFIMMDEATANLDLQTEQQVQQALPVLLENKGALIVAHRLSTIVQMDKIVVLEAGHVVQIGTHETLSQQEGLYRRLLERGKIDEV